MTVSELIEWLQQFEQDKEVLFIEPDQGDWFFAPYVQMEFDEEFNKYILLGET